MTAQLTRKGSQVTRKGIADRAAAPATQACPGRLRGACRRIRLTIQEMNYASRRVVERQAPWIVDEQWYRR
jgi:hypothetical protein